MDGTVRLRSLRQWALTSLSGLPMQPLMQSTTSAYNGSNRVIGGSYDAAGNQTVYGAYQIGYDAENRQISAQSTHPSLSASYTYDGFGQRVTKALAGANTTVYVHDVLGNLMAEYTTGSASTPLCTTCYMSLDHLGSTRMVTDGSGNVVARHDYLPFGVEVPAGYGGRTTAWGTVDSLNPKFTGQERDTETGVDFFQARYHGSAQGRFLSPDPLGNFVADPTNPQSWNQYSYVFNNPLILIDPTGTTTCDQNGNNCYDSVTVNGGPPPDLPMECIFYSFLCSSPPPVSTQPPPPPGGSTATFSVTGTGKRQGIPARARPQRTHLMRRTNYLTLGQ